MLELPAISKLIDYIAAGVGGIAGPLLAPWAARRRAKAVVIEAQGQADAQRILAASEAHQVQAISQAQLEARQLFNAPPHLDAAGIGGMDPVGQAWQFQQDKRIRNIQAVAEAAAADLGDETVSSDDPDPDLDWAARFFSGVQDVSSAEMQQLWARVLAGEVRRPGSTSIRTLEILRNLDRRIATVFQMLCALSTSLVVPAAGVRLPEEVVALGFDARHRRLIIDQRVIVTQGNAASNALKSYGLDFGTLNVLNEYGLIISDYNSWRDYRPVVFAPNAVATGPVRIDHARRRWVLIQDSGNTTQGELRQSGVALTSAGRELASVVDFEPEENYLAELRGHFQSQGLRLVEVAN